VIGRFLDAAAQNYGIYDSGLWLAISISGLLLASFCAYRDMRLAGRIMLLLETVSILANCPFVYCSPDHVTLTTGLSATPFVPAQDFHGWSGSGVPWSSASSRSPDSRRMLYGTGHPLAATKWLQNCSSN
jgi:hypothetical protein